MCWGKITSMIAHMPQSSSIQFSPHKIEEDGAIR